MDRSSEKTDAITNVDGVCGGVPCIAGTRIPVWVLEHCRSLGMSDDEILLDYPDLTHEELNEAWAYVAAHEEEIRQQIRENTE
jgi:uncharacterized protein (DUF433 family)